MSRLWGRYAQWFCQVGCRSRRRMDHLRRNPFLTCGNSDRSVHAPVGRCDTPGRLPAGMVTKIAVRKWPPVWTEMSDSERFSSRFVSLTSELMGKTVTSATAGNGPIASVRLCPKLGPPVSVRGYGRLRGG